jgi:thymidylate synthase ThyX
VAVDLVEPGRDPLDEVVATLLYRHDQSGHSFRQIVDVVAAMSQAQKQEVFDLSVRHRGAHDDLLREHQAGYGLIFDILVDLGSFRDLHRHRRCVQVQQPLTFDASFALPEQVFVWGLGPQAALAALEAGLGEHYVEALAKAEQAAAHVRATDPRAADYLIPLGYRTRCLFKMDWAQAAYMIEQRTQPQGHFSYRRVAWGMYEALRARWPSTASAIRASDPDGPLDLLRR